MRPQRGTNRARGTRSVARATAAGLVASLVGALGVVAVTVPSAEPAQAAVETYDPFEVNQGFSYVATGDLSFGNGEIEGSAAAFGTLQSTSGNYPVLHHNSGTADYEVPAIDGDPVRLLADRFVGSGAFDLTNRDSSGIIDPDSPEATASAKLADTANLTGGPRGNDFTRLTNDAGGVMDLESLPWDEATWRDTVTTDQGAVADYFGDVDGQVERTNACLADMYTDPELAHEVTVEGDANQVFLSDFSTTTPNYVDYEDVAGAVIKMDRAGGYAPTPQAPLVVRVSDPTTTIGPLNVEGWSPQEGQQQSYARSMMLDLSRVTGPVTIDGLEMGAVWAPGVDLDFTGSRSTNGQWFADDITTSGGGELHHHTFLGELPCDDTRSAPSITTSVAVPGGDGALSLDGGVVTDTVSYTGLTPGTEYELDGVVMTSDGEETGITGATTFTPDAPNGTIDVTFPVTAAQAAEHAGQDLVAFESLTVDGEPVASHEDLADEEQTFTVQAAPPVEITTNVAVPGSDDGVVTRGGHVVDTVSYTGLTPGTEYVLDGRVMTSDGEETGITGTTTFTPDAADGTVDVSFSVSGQDVRDHAGQDLVVFETLTAGGEPVASHEDLADEEQTFSVAAPPEPATFAVAKQLDGSGATLVPEDTVFTVEFEVVAGPDEGETGELEVPADGTAVTYPGDLADGDVLTFSEPELPEVEGVEWGTPTITPDPVVLDADGDPAAVTVTNTATAEQAAGGFSVAKQVDGSGAGQVEPGTEFEIGWEVVAGPDEGLAGTLTVPADGTPVDGPDDLADGDVVELTELSADEVPADGADFAGVTFDPSTIVIDAAADPVTVTATNTYDLAPGTFEVRKEITGDGADRVPDDAEFHVAWEVTDGPSAGASGTLAVPADGSAVTGPDLLHGDTVTFGELSPPAVEGVEWGTETIEPEQVTIDGGGEPAAVTVTNVAEAVGGPTVRTEASVPGSPDGVLPAGGGAVVDTVSYEGLTPGTEYELHGELREAVGGAATGIEATTTFTPSAADGTAEVEFTLDADDAARYAGADLVVVESLTAGGDEVAEHADLADGAQTFSVAAAEPSIATVVAVEGSDGKVLAREGGTVVDTVRYEGLRPGTTYTVSGEAALASTGALTGITGTAEFTPTSASGAVDVTFEVSAETAAALAGERLVVFEEVSTDGATVVAERDVTDEDQTFTVADQSPAISTAVAVEGSAGGKVVPASGGTVVDTVSYTGLTPGTRYVVSGSLMRENLGSTGVAGSAAFTPTSPDGTVEVEFAVDADDARDHPGEYQVLFEGLWAGGDLLASHSDIDDEAQTFRIAGPDAPTPAPPSDGDDDGGMLPVTGAEAFGWLVGAAVVSLLVGFGLLAVRRWGLRG